MVVRFLKFIPGLGLDQPTETPGFSVVAGHDINAHKPLQKATIARSLKKSQPRLAFYALLRDIRGERLAVDGPLANPVRTGR